MPLKHFKWSQEEEQNLVNFVNQYGKKTWKKIAQKLNKQYTTHKRTGKQCRERWNNHCRNDLEPSKWTEANDHDLVQLHFQHGNKWVDIALHFKGKSVNQIKNHFYATARKGLRRMTKFAKTVEKQINVYKIKPITIGSILTKQSTYVGTEHNSNFESELAKYLIAFMMVKKQQIQTLEATYSISSVKDVLKKIVKINQSLCQQETNNQKMENNQQKQQLPIAPISTEQHSSNFNQNMANQTLRVSHSSQEQQLKQEIQFLAISRSFIQEQSPYIQQEEDNEYIFKIRTEPLDILGSKFQNLLYNFHSFSDLQQ